MFWQARAYGRRNDVAWERRRGLVCGRVEKNPRYFQKYTPFIGYVQILWEGSFRTETRLDIRGTYAVGGKH